MSTLSPPAPSARIANEGLILGYSSMGHALMHYMAAFFPYIAVGMAASWGEPGKPLDHQVVLLPLWQLAAFLLGLVALPSGWLSDRWSAPGMIVVMFMGMGVSSIACAFVPDRDFLLLELAMAALGVFAAIYHAVGIAWVMRNSSRPGHAMGINGVFGSAGLAACGAVTGLLINFFSWRAAFLVPGVVCLIIGLGLLYHWKTGRVSDRPMPAMTGKAPSRGDLVRVFIILTVTMFAGGVIWQAIQYGAPGLFEQRMATEIDWLQTVTNGQLAAEAKKMAFWVGLFGSAVYLASGVTQYFLGGLSDRYSLKTVYTICAFLQILAMVGLGLLPGYGVLVAAMASAIISSASGPAENLLIGRYTPTKYHGLGFGAKFIVAFGAGPVAIWLIAHLKALTGSLELLFLGLAATGVLVWLVALMLPSGDSKPAASPAVPRPVPAE
ncbi:MFS transporter [Reyranella sp. CPCC 100927]|uniref:MFS transporter n=1 Tax=Reyranella sp. CPCC 100927 TaxID=2599616 RepID=UPI0011B5967E|nr:MFS transporter [Reyranella sp. CPCC 100927]TWT09708.1 MFS transporter [Reyranella sp. CPCC 100927]